MRLRLEELGGLSELIKAASAFAACDDVCCVVALVGVSVAATRRSGGSSRFVLCSTALSAVTGTAK